jgi:hypothetical protein
MWSVNNLMKNLEKAKELWELMERDALFGEIESGALVLESPFLHFSEGTPSEDIWLWFEEEFSVSVAEDLMYERN